jgi:sugar/nucleoside kinase (ribokinase family)
MTADPSGDLIRFVIAGRLNRDFILPLSGQPQLDLLGGNLAYAAIGLNLWGETGGMVSRVAQQFPWAWLEKFRSLGFDLSGIREVQSGLDMRRFLAYDSLESVHTENPVQHFADRGLAYPPSLLGYTGKAPSSSSRTQPTPQTIQISDIPDSYLEASAIHICPVDYLSHLILPPVFRQGQATTITLSSDPGYMQPSFWEEIPALLSDITAFITTESEIRALFQARQTDLWEMAAQLAQFGPEYILIRTLSYGYCVYDRLENKRWTVPFYQSQVVDPTGASDAFAGGFLAGYRAHYDPLEAALMGSISASMVVEGSGAFYALDAMPGLLEKRLIALRELVQRV